MSEPESLEELLAMRQRERDRQRALFDRAIREAEPAPEELRRLLLLNLTTKPQGSYLQLALSWMQRDPDAWPGYHPEQCEPVSRMTGHGEDV